jgi:hypothetical protein
MQLIPATLATLLTTGTTAKFRVSLYKRRDQNLLTLSDDPYLALGGPTVLFAAPVNPNKAPSTLCSATTIA